LEALGNLSEFSLYDQKEEGGMELLKIFLDV
jgi:hypothetical protein